MTLALSSSVLADDMLYDVAQPVELGVGRTLVVLQASTPSDQGWRPGWGEGHWSWPCLVSGRPKRRRSPIIFTLICPRTAFPVLTTPVTWGTEFL
ncbi:hypothetical protein QNM99_08580 [Pseudomonas sp. PCH446]